MKRVALSLALAAAVIAAALAAADKTNWRDAIKRSSPPPLPPATVTGWAELSLLPPGEAPVTYLVRYTVRDAEWSIQIVSRLSSERAADPLGRAVGQTWTMRQGTLTVYHPPREETKTANLAEALPPLVLTGAPSGSDLPDFPHLLQAQHQQQAHLTPPPAPSEKGNARPATVNVKDLGERREKGRTFRVLQLRYPAPLRLHLGHEVSQTDLWIDQEQQVIVRTVSYNSSGAVASRTFYRNFRTLSGQHRPAFESETELSAGEASLQALSQEQARRSPSPQAKAAQDTTPIQLPCPPRKVVRRYQWVDNRAFLPKETLVFDDGGRLVLRLVFQEWYVEKNPPSPRQAGRAKRTTR